MAPSTPDGQAAPAIDPGPGGGVSPTAGGVPDMDYIKSLHADGRLLLDFVAHRTRRALADLPQHDGCFDILLAKPETIARAARGPASLLLCVDELSYRAAPADAHSIRLTTAYLASARKGRAAPDDERRAVRNIRWGIWTVTAITMLLLPLAIVLLAHMNTGRGLLQQLDVARRQEQDIRRDIAALPLAETVTRHIEIGRQASALPAPDPPAPVTPAGTAAVARGPAGLDDGIQICSKPPDLAAGTTGTDARALTPDRAVPERTVISWREPATQKALTVCRRYDDNRVRLAMIYTGFTDWNCQSHRMLWYWIEQAFAGARWLLGMEPRWADVCGEPMKPLPPELDRPTWWSHETWVSATSAVLAGFILPLVLGCLGGCTYVLRRFDRSLGDYTLRPNEGSHALTRVTLAALLGGLIGVFWTSFSGVTTITGATPAGGVTMDGGIVIGGVTLTLAALAFFIGFSVEAAFKAIETVIKRLTQRLDKSLAEPAAEDAAPGPSTPAKPATTPDAATEKGGFSASGRR